MLADNADMLDRSVTKEVLSLIAGNTSNLPVSPWSATVSFHVSVSRLCGLRSYFGLPFSDTGHCPSANFVSDPFSGTLCSYTFYAGYFMQKNYSSAHI